MISECSVIDRRHKQSDGTSSIHLWFIHLVEVGPLEAFLVPGTGDGDFSVLHAVAALESHAPEVASAWVSSLSADAAARGNDGCVAEFLDALDRNISESTAALVVASREALAPPTFEQRDGLNQWVCLRAAIYGALRAGPVTAADLQQLMLIHVSGQLP